MGGLPRDAGRLSDGCQTGCQTVVALVVKRLSDGCQNVVRRAPRNCQTVVGRLSDSCRDPLLCAPPFFANASHENMFFTFCAPPPGALPRQVLGPLPDNV